jgi:tetraacyldisaccharide 4'-kinase
MPHASHEFISNVMGGTDTSLRGRALRVATAVVEPFYATTMRARNGFYSVGMFRSRRLPRPTISVGNITTGGTGKTPVVRWLAGRLREAGRRPAVLLRGYRSDAAGMSDERQLLDRGLNSAGLQPAVPVEANPNRIAGAEAVLRQRNDVDVFVLDDAFQHQKVQRNFNLVLISATDPFGFRHVLPRGLLREPLSGLRRADAFLITRCSQVDHEALKQIETELHRRKPTAPIFRADHVHTALWSPASNTRLPANALLGQRFFSFCGIGNPSAFDQQLRSLGGEYVGHQWFADHHTYTNADIIEVVARAVASRAARIVTTEKDWVKIAALEATKTSELPISVLELGIHFHRRDDDHLFERIFKSIQHPAS